MLKHNIYVYIRLATLDRGRPLAAPRPRTSVETGEAVATLTTGSVITEGVTGAGDATKAGVRRKTRAGLGI
jgi:hypothetical protein